MSKNLHDLGSLDPPSLSWRAMIRHFGPGTILMMTGVGTSHLVTAPVAGGRFEYALLWCVPAAYAFKYYGFEMAFRFTYATGRSMLDAYSTAWRKWPLWYVLVTTLLQCVVGQAGRLIAASAVFYFVSTEYLGLDIPIVVHAFLLGSVSVALIQTGKYSVMEIVAKACAGALLISTVVIYCVEPAPLSAAAHLVGIEMPDGSWWIVAALLGLLPTGIDVSLQASEWGKAKQVGMARIRQLQEQQGLATPFDPFDAASADLSVQTDLLTAEALEYRRRWLHIGLWDFRLGHLASFVMACLFLLLAAVWLYPSPVEGNAVMGEIAGIFTKSVGPWMMILFLISAFAATFSTSFNYFDGWPRVVGACCRNLFRATAASQGIGKGSPADRRNGEWYCESNLYRFTMWFSLGGAIAIIAGVQQPVWLVLAASALSYVVAPVLYGLNLYYCFAVISKADRDFYPSRFAAWFGWGSLVVFTAMMGLLILARVFGWGGL